MLDDIFKISREFLRIFYRPYKRYFLVKYPLSGRFSIITGQCSLTTAYWTSDIGHYSSIQRVNGMDELQKSESVSVSRREFCRKAIKRSSVAAAVGVAGYLAYRKPAVRSFFGASDAYAANTGDDFLSGIAQRIVVRKSV